MHIKARIKDEDIISFNVDDKFVIESHSLILKPNYCRQKQNLAFCRLVLKQYIGYKLHLHTQWHNWWGEVPRGTCRRRQI